MIFRRNRREKGRAFLAFFSCKVVDTSGLSKALGSPYFQSSISKGTSTQTQQFNLLKFTVHLSMLNIPFCLLPVTAKHPVATKASSLAIPDM